MSIDERREALRADLAEVREVLDSDPGWTALELKRRVRTALHNENARLHAAMSREAAQVRAATLRDAADAIESSDYDPGAVEPVNVSAMNFAEMLRFMAAPEPETEGGADA